MSILTMHHGLMAGIKQGDPPGYVTIGGRLYRTVTIGTQTWLAENLDYKFSGCVIGSGVSSTEARGNYYNNDETTYGEQGNKYGLLYNWIAVKLLNDNRSTLCPGWHVATETEWNTLVAATGGESSAGKHLRSAIGWSGPAGLDTYGFTAVPTGMRTSNNGAYSGVGIRTRFFTATQYDTYQSVYFDVSSNYDAVLSNHTSWGNEYSVRLVKDA